MLRRPQSNTILTIALILLVGFNVGYFLPRFPSQSQNLFSLIPGAFALASPANYLSFQGQLTDQNGAPITTTKSLAFSLYDASAAGNLIYNETQSITPDSRGIFYALIGSGTVGSPAGSQGWPPKFDVQYWLAVRVTAGGAYLSPRIAITSAPYLQGNGAASTVAFSSSANTCTDTTLTTSLMMGFGLTYTTSAITEGEIFVTLTFDLASPASATGLTSKWTITYGTGSAPACNAGAVGTLVGNQYATATESATVLLEHAESVSVVITGLTASTTYWLDVQASDSSTAGWIYSKPAISVYDIPTGNSGPSFSFSSNSNTCGRNTAATAMAGLGVTYTTGAAGFFSGQVFVGLTFDVQSPATTTITSAWQVAYGTGSAPACNGATAGTTLGQSYTVETEANVILELAQSGGVVITGLSAATTYWFDVQVTDSTTAVWNYAKPDLALLEMPSSNNLPADVALQTNTQSCPKSTTAASMAGLNLLYTTSTPTSGNIFVALTVAAQSPGVSNVNSKWQLAYGTGAVPTCGGSTSGTTVGNQYTTNTQSAIPLRLGQAEGVTITGLLPNTQYWFDIQLTDSTTDTWTYSVPTLSVSEPLLAVPTVVTPCSNVANALCNNPTTTQILTYAGAGVGTIIQMATGATASPFIIQNSLATSIWTIDTTGTLIVGSVPWTRLTSFPSGCAANTFVQTLGTTPTCNGAASWANLVSFPSACSAGQWVYTVGGTLTCDAPNTGFSSNTSTCTISSITANLGAFTTSPAYTTSASRGTGTIIVSLNWQINTPKATAITTTYLLTYGTGTAPSCAASNAGTTVGNSYSFETTTSSTGGEQTVGKISPSVTARITGLTANTAYWFDLQVTDTTTDNWTYLNPQLTVIET